MEGSQEEEAKKGETPEKGKAAQWKRQNKSTNGIVIKTKSKTYAELLRTVKDTIDIDEMRVKIKTFRKTIKGNIYVQVERDIEKTNN